MTTRRTFLAAACGTCAAALTGCAVYGPPRPVAAAPGPAPLVPEPVAGPVPVTGAKGVEEAAPDAPVTEIPVADALAAAATIPVGGGLVFADLDLVVTQPTAGQYKAFSATCTHQGCAVTEVTGGQIICPCHGSTFSAADGSPTAGPAATPLPERAVSFQGGSIVLG
jgi:Rieske Fe-S protein